MKSKNKTHITLILMALLTVLLAFRPAGNCSISGKVTDENEEGIPVANVVVMQNGKSVGGGTTDFDGSYCISNLAAGTYDMEVIYIGYDKQEVKKVLVTDGKPTLVD
ncbi:MAG TPA: carboxypeptidase-like regulatory domain-containing protein, partial [Chitinophagales bacterium]|nr:carboxypeptidase-like regulatory domain-containing protein [Chitinophagales bacterium]